MNHIQIFQNEQFGKVRIVLDDNNEPLFCLTDVAKALGYNRPADAVNQHCKGVVVLPTPTNGGMQNATTTVTASVSLVLPTAPWKLPHGKVVWTMPFASTTQRC